MPTPYELLKIEQPSNSYQILGVKAKSDFEVVNKAYKKLVLQWHPDKYIDNAKFTQAESEETFKLINTVFKRIQKRHLSHKPLSKTVDAAQSPKAPSQQNVALQVFLASAQHLKSSTLEDIQTLNKNDSIDILNLLKIFAKSKVDFTTDENISTLSQLTKKQDSAIPLAAAIFSVIAQENTSLLTTKQLQYVFSLQDIAKVEVAHFLDHLQKYAKPLFQYKMIKDLFKSLADTPTKITSLNPLLVFLENHNILNHDILSTAVASINLPTEEIFFSISLISALDNTYPTKLTQEMIQRIFSASLAQCHFLDQLLNKQPSLCVQEVIDYILAPERKQKSWLDLTSSLNKKIIKIIAIAEFMMLLKVPATLCVISDLMTFLMNEKLSRENLNRIIQSADMLSTFNTAIKGLHEEGTPLNNTMLTIVLDNLHQFREVNELIKQSQRIFYTAAIAEIKDNLKIDITDKTHLSYWNEQTAVTIFNTGGRIVTLDDIQYRVPTRVYEMMMTRVDENISDTAYLAKLNRARGSRPSFFSNPFSSMMQKSATTELYGAQDLRHFKI